MAETAREKWEADAASLFSWEVVRSDEMIAQIDAIEAEAVERERARIAEAVRRLADMSAEDWEDRPGGDPIARTLNAVLRIVKP